MRTMKMAKLIRNMLIGTGAVATIYAGYAGGNYYLDHGFGSRGIIREYSFNLNGEWIDVVRKDLRLAPDKYYMIGKKVTILTGSVESDSGKTITLMPDGYSVR
jgi:hypothetical protein